MRMGISSGSGAVLVVLCLTTGCVSFSNFQTAEVTKSGDTAASGIGITATRIAPTDEAVTDDVYEDATYTMLTFLWRYGISERVGIGGKIYGVSPVVGIAFDGKYQFMDGEAFDAAIDGGIAITGLEVDSSDNSYVDYSGSLLFTYHMSDSASVTLVPKVIFRDINTEGSDESETMVGGTVTLALGKEEKMKVFPEAGFYHSDEADFIHYGVGFIW